MQRLSKDFYFPPVETAASDGIVAIGGDLSPERLMLAYNSGIFPWFEQGDPIVWWSPDPRMVLFPDDLRISKSMRNILNKNIFAVTFNTDFENVIRNCRDIKRDGQGGTWITDSMTKAYCELNRRGYAKSVEVWQDGELVGGLYGVDLGQVFCGESMFSKVANASKVAFVALVSKLKAENYKLLDCQIYNEHLESLGAREISRADFLRILKS
ncbi:MAG: leucyl/phenylalanyl-tRNA--protein transferase [Flavobacterium sp.]|nr:leucyl/phenylalanyl-tRNA--protein transferase [Flavobacterium sp.]